MSFEELYESCFRNLSLVKVPQKEKDKDSDPSLLVTLDHVMCRSQQVIFFLGGGQSRSELPAKLQNMVEARNKAPASGKPESSPARIRRFFGMKKKKKSKENFCEQVAVSVVYVHTDPHGENSTDVALPGWYIFAPQNATTKSRLLRSLGFEVAPSLCVVDCASRGVVSTEGRRLLQEDPLGQAFPWWPPAADQVLSGPLQRVQGENKETLEWKQLNTKVKALFFGAYWCPPCRQWVQQLIPAYKSLKTASISVEIIFCSSDRTQQFYDEFTSQMPWLSFPYNPAHTVLLTRLFNITGIPALVLIDEENRVITRHGRQALVSDPKGVRFPWGPQPYYELTEMTVCKLRDEPSMVLFTEGSPEDVQFSTSAIEKVSNDLFEERLEWERKRHEEAKEKRDENGNGGSRQHLQHSSSQEECSSVDSDMSVPPQADPLQIFITGDDPICDHILEKILGLGDAELPLICIVDALGGRVSVCTEPDVSPDIISQFVSSYKAGKLQWQNLPTPPEQNNRTVGGIPMQDIEKALMGSSTSQNSISNQQML